jgi:hypothetical protein
MIDARDLAPPSGWASASLRIASETVTVEAISDQLGLVPTSTRTAEGEPAFVVWMLESDLAPSSPLEDHLYILMERLRDLHDALAELAVCANVEVWLGYSPAVGGHRNAIFGHQVLAELGALGIDLVFDPYPAGLAHRNRDPET